MLLKLISDAPAGCLSARQETELLKFIPTMRRLHSTFMPIRETKKVNELYTQEVKNNCLDMVVQLDRMWQQMHGELVSSLGTVINTKYESDALPNLISSVMGGRCEPHKFQRVRQALAYEHIADKQVEPFLQTLQHLETLCVESNALQSVALR